MNIPREIDMNLYLGNVRQFIAGNRQIFPLHSRARIYGFFINDLGVHLEWGTSSLPVYKFQKAIMDFIGKSEHYGDTHQSYGGLTARSVTFTYLDKESKELLERFENTFGTENFAFDESNDGVDLTTMLDEYERELEEEIANMSDEDDDEIQLPEGLLDEINNENHNTPSNYKNMLDEIDNEIQLLEGLLEEINNEDKK